MGIEIERKFLLASDAWRARADAGTRMVQGYLVDARAIAQGLTQSSVRVRVEGDKACLNIKSAQAGVCRQEYQYPLPLGEAVEILETLCRGRIEKIRYCVGIGPHVYEIDEFLGENTGLVVAEVELSAVDEAFARPPWLGKEVSHLARYYNVHLVTHPWSSWSPGERAGEEVVSCS